MAGELLQHLRAGDQGLGVGLDVGQVLQPEVVAMAVGWAPNRLKADPNGSGVNPPDTDDILAPHSWNTSPKVGNSRHLKR
jgi:hypothetical protein